MVIISRKVQATAIKLKRKKEKRTKLTRKDYDRYNTINDFLYACTSQLLLIDSFKNLIDSIILNSRKLKPEEIKLISAFAASHNYISIIVDLLDRKKVLVRQLERIARKSRCEYSQSLLFNYEKNQREGVEETVTREKLKPAYEAFFNDRDNSQPFSLSQSCSISQKVYDDEDDVLNCMQPFLDYFYTTPHSPQRQTDNIFDDMQSNDSNDQIGQSIEVEY